MNHVNSQHTNRTQHWSVLPTHPFFQSKNKPIGPGLASALAHYKAMTTTNCWTNWVPNSGPWASWEPTVNSSGVSEGCKGPSVGLTWASSVPKLLPLQALRRALRPSKVAGVSWKGWGQDQQNPSGYGIQRYTLEKGLSKPIWLKW